MNTVCEYLSIKRYFEVHCFMAVTRRGGGGFASWPLRGEGEGALLHGPYEDWGRGLCFMAVTRIGEGGFASWPLRGVGEGALLHGRYEERGNGSN